MSLDTKRDKTRKKNQNDAIKGLYSSTKADRRLKKRERQRRLKGRREQWS